MSTRAISIAPGEALAASHARAAQYIEEYGIGPLVQGLSENPDYLTEALALDADYVATHYDAVVGRKGVISLSLRLEGFGSLSKDGDQRRFSIILNISDLTG